MRAAGSRPRRKGVRAPAPPDDSRPRPFLKWAGGKGKLLGELASGLPPFKRYHEPFLGGAALFFELVCSRGLRAAFLSDANPALVDAYVAVRDDVDRVIRSLKEHRNAQEHFYRIRSQDPASLKPAERAARLIFLNKTCYNGLYRENRRGEFNVPFGRYKNPTICDEANLRAASRALQAARIECRDFGSVLEKAKPGDLVYFDPPYDPLSATSSFTAYNRDGFGRDDQRRLRDTFAELARKDVCVMLSNSRTGTISQLYRGFEIQPVQVPRAINSKPDRRGNVSELIIRSWKR